MATVAACQFQNHQERALCVLHGMGYLSGPLSVSRFNRRAHALADWFALLLDVLGEVFASGQAFVVDSLPLPVCRRVRAPRCRKVRGDEYYGYCAAKEEKFYGWRLHLVCTPIGIAAFDLLPASCHDLTPVHELIERVPGGAWVYGDKAYNSADDEAMIEGETGGAPGADPQDEYVPNPIEGLRVYRKGIEGVNSQLAVKPGHPTVTRPDTRGLSCSGAGVTLRAPARTPTSNHGGEFPAQESSHAVGTGRNAEQRWPAWQPKRLALHLLVVVAAMAVVVLMTRSVVPYIADHSETALPIPGGLPFRLHHAGRTYLNPETCAGEDWCSGRPQCFTMADLDAIDGTLLVSVGAVRTFLGAAHPLFVAPDSVVPHLTAETPTYRLVVFNREGYYVVYGLSGGL